ncbi:MAG: NmrA family transcriptional regulator [Pseudomonadota bacterium]
MTHQQILIVGANGKTGARVQSRLHQAGISTRGVSRSTTPAFDWGDSSNWAAALSSMDAAYLTYHPDLSVPAAEEHIRRFCELATTSGLQHVVLLSGRGEEGAARSERVLRASGLEWNIVQASWFAQNFSEDFMLDAVLGGELVIPAGTATEPFIDLDDLADVVVATFLEPGLRNRLFEVTGPRSISFGDCMAEISSALNRPIRLTEVAMPDYVDSLRAQGVPEYLVELLPSLFADVFDGRNAHCASGVREALGRPATDFGDFARKTAASGVWQSPHEQGAA